MDHVIAELRRMYAGPAWHGPCLQDALRDVTARQAAARPLPAAHSIFELTHHIGAWIGEVESRLRGNASSDPADGDWPAAITVTDERWRDTVARVETRHNSLIAFLRTLDAARLDAIVDANAPSPEQQRVTGYILLHGLVQHNAYHIGQIMLLRKG
jgi:uncharacterized damage-inducible protein DinB